ncbi:hypothetical protein M5K25_009731 [Dendrobium thyrsiflorum]|uniref:R13L1/DRL21-like LRR repeat region domain-containing protein n=1 Tax=Dendrobium thyrsiflorum TaxID=117978 RepID=A0ABD0VDB0_DENTH
MEKHPFVVHTCSILREIPEEIGHLTHLRYFNIVENRINQMPRSLSNIYHLQFIICNDKFNCGNGFVPRDMNNLRNLQYLKFPFPGMHEIGKLNSLQELHGFFVTNEAGYRLGELEHMNELQLLVINFHENVDDTNEAHNAKLYDKRNLMDLSLKWPYFGCIYNDILRYSHNFMRNAVDGLDENVLDNLQPHSNLKKLKIYGFMGVSSTSRQICPYRTATYAVNFRASLVPRFRALCIDPHPTPRARALSLQLRSRALHPTPRARHNPTPCTAASGQCPTCPVRPPRAPHDLAPPVHPPSSVLPASNLPACAELTNSRRLAASDGISSSALDDPTAKANLTSAAVSRTPPSYTDRAPLLDSPGRVLYIGKLQALKDWFVATAVAYECLFPCLIEMYLQDCPNLQELPALPPKLKILNMHNIGWKGSNWLQGISNNCSISIRHCPNLISLIRHQKVETTDKCQLILSELIINDPSLLLMESLRSVTSIQKLEIKENDAVISFPIEAEQRFLQVSSSLCELGFRYLKSLQSLPSSLEILSSLKILHVEEVPQLQLRPNMPASLEQLELKALKSLRCLPSSLSFSSIKHLNLKNIPSLCKLQLDRLEYLDCLPSCPHNLYSLQELYIDRVPQLRELPDLPPSLCLLYLSHLSNLPCLPSCLSSLQSLYIITYPQLRELPDLPPSLKTLIIQNCHPELKERCQKITGLDWHKIAHIPSITISHIVPQ